MSKASGRFSRFPAVNRGVPGHGSTYPERVAGTPLVEAPVPASDPEPQVEVETVDLEAMTVNEVLHWAGDDAERRAFALDAELTGRNRKGVLNALSE